MGMRPPRDLWAEPLDDPTQVLWEFFKRRIQADEVTRGAASRYLREGKTPGEAVERVVGRK
jgi:hypothetical protein